MINKRKLVKWNQTSGGLYFPEELELFEKIEKGLVDAETAKGFCSIYRFPADDDGNAIREKQECLNQGPNLIVNLGRASLASLQRATVTATSVEGSLDLGLLAVGHGSGGGAGHTPLPTDSTLQNEDTDPVGGPVVSGVPRPTLQVTTPAPSPFTTNLWVAQLGTTQLNGIAIDEAALLCLDDTTMFSYRTFAAQNKTSGFVMEFRWSILF